MTTSMDLNNNSNTFLVSDFDLTTSDTTLRLDCFRYGGNMVDDGCKLVLGLGPTSTMHTEDCYNFIGSNKNNSNKGFTALLNNDLSSAGDDDSILRLGLSGCTDDEISALDYSVTTPSTTTSSVPHNHLDQVFASTPVVDEGSTSAKKSSSGGYMTSLLMAPRMENNNKCLFMQTKELLELVPKSHCRQTERSSEPSIISEYSWSNVSGQTIAATSSEACKTRNNNPKRCKIEGCNKGPRGVTGLCIGHGGGERCKKSGCNKGAESRTAFCKAHGGGRRCLHLGCTKSAEGNTDHCIAHGGGRRCCFPEGCHKAARGRSGLCIKHGGGKRCKVEGCSRSAEGQLGLCISHGGGRRCQFPNCVKGAQGSTCFCKAHGGGKRCIFANCTKGAEGSTPLCKAHGGGKRCLFDGGGICPKSVHGGTNFCVAHGGGKRCIFQGCTKSARGRTDYCVRHGGGKRCKVENCDKSAQGSTDFCKAHGGGKRCSYLQGKCDKFARGKGGLCAAHTSLVYGREKNKVSMIGPGLFHGIVHSSSSSILSCMMSSSIHSFERPSKRQQLIPPEVLVPLSMKSSSTPLSSQKEDERSTGVGIARSHDTNKSFEFVIPEGRVHGGGLMSLLGQNMKKI